MEHFTVNYTPGDGARLSASYGKDGSDAGSIVADIINELEKARAKFPSSEASMTALMEEVGELAKAYLDEPRANIRAEAIQVATMAIRVALEGDPTLEAYRFKRRSTKL